MLRDVLDRILAGSRLPAELIAVDQSAEPNVNLAAMDAPGGCRFVYLPTRTVGLSRGLNLGVLRASHELLIFTHDDVLPQPDWCERMVAAALAVGPMAVVTGRVGAGAPEVGGAYAPSLSKMDEPTIVRGRVGPDLIHPMNLAIDRATLENVGAWDVRLGPGTPFPGGEDHDLEFRLREAGVAVVYRPEVGVVHRAWRAPGTYFALRWGYGRGQGAFLAKHFSLDDRYALTRFGMEVAERARSGLAMMAHDPRRGAARIVLAVGMVAGAADWLRSHRRLSSSRFGPLPRRKRGIASRP